MNVTEADARNNACPCAREAVCLGSNCMAWRWNSMPSRIVLRAENRNATDVKDAGPLPLRAVGFDFNPYDEAEGGEAAWLEPDEQRAARRTGFCGLAGKPEYGS